MARSSDGIQSKNNAVPRLLQAAYAAADRAMWSDAEKLLNEAIGIDPQCVDAYVKLGLIFETQGRLNEAREALERSVELDERQPVLTVLASVQRRLGDHSAATGTVERSLSIDPTDEEALHLSGLLLMATNSPKAVERFEKVLFLNPTHRYTHREMALALWTCHRLEDAITACRRAIEIDPNDEWAHNYLGDMLFGSHDIDEARREYLFATELAPQNGLLWASLGRLYTAVSEYSRAEEAFRTGLAVAIDEPVLHREYGILLKKTGRLTTAKRYLIRSLELNPDQDRVLKALEEIKATERGFD